MRSVTPSSGWSLSVRTSPATAVTPGTTWDGWSDCKGQSRRLLCSSLSPDGRWLIACSFTFVSSAIFTPYKHFREGELLWECKAGLLPILQPHIRLYYLPSKPRSGNAQGR